MVLVKKIAYTALLVTCLSAFCQDTRLDSPSTIERAKTMAKTSPSFPLDRAHAAIMIDLYTDAVIHAHCFSTDIMDDGENWSCTPNIGDDCQPDKHKILVNKKTGSISWEGGPKYPNPRAFGVAMLHKFSKRQKSSKHASCKEMQ